jgi:hypothetical protein
VGKNYTYPEQTPIYYDVASWGEGYRRGFVDGHKAGADWGAWAVKDCLLKHLDAWGADLRLGLHDAATPEDTWREMGLLVRDYDLPKATPIAP